MTAIWSEKPNSRKSAGSQQPESWNLGDSLHLWILLELQLQTRLDGHHICFRHLDAIDLLAQTVNHLLRESACQGLKCGRYFA